MNEEIKIIVKYVVIDKHNRSLDVIWNISPPNWILREISYRQVVSELEKICKPFYFEVLTEKMALSLKHRLQQKISLMEMVGIIRFPYDRMERG